MAVRNGRSFALSYGDVSSVSVWSEPEVVSQPAPLRVRQWDAWHESMLRATELHQPVGGIEVVERYSLMLIPPQSWPEKINRGPAIGWPIFQAGKAVNVVRRFLDNKEPRYAGLPGRGVQIWPDVKSMNGHDEELLLVTGMRDASCCIAAGINTYTATGGVNSWVKATNCDSWGPGRRFSICFDIGEELWAENLASHLVGVGAKSVRVLTLKKLIGECEPGIKDLADIAETQSLRTLRKVIRLGRARTDTWA